MRKTEQAVVDYSAVDRAIPLSTTHRLDSDATRRDEEHAVPTVDAQDSIRWLRCELEVTSAYADFLREQVRALTHERNQQATVIASLQADVDRLGPFERELLEHRLTPRYRIADCVNAAVKRVAIVHRLARLGFTWMCRPKQGS